MTTTYRIRIRLGENEIEIEGDKDFVTQTYPELKGEMLDVALAHRVPKGDADEITPPELATEPGPPLASFLKQKGARSHADKIITIAVYLYKHRDVKEFTTADIEVCYKEALLKKPKNINDRINANRKKGYIDVTGEEREGLKTFCITSEGLDYVEKGLVSE
jgi:hypothetical protein